MRLQGWVNVAMRLPRVRFTVRRMMVAVAIIALIAAGTAELKRRRLRDAEIQRALLSSLQPPDWWPAEWRQELNTSFSLSHRPPRPPLQPAKPAGFFMRGKV